VDRLRVEVADIDVLKEGYLELKEDNKRLQEQIAALIEASKRAGVCHLQCRHYAMSC
jgi:hypothetical protein